MSELIITVVLSLSTAMGGFATGRRMGVDGTVNVATQTVELLQAQVDSIKLTLSERESEIKRLKDKVEILESLVTQRAAVEEVREIVDRIAEKMGA